MNKHTNKCQNVGEGTVNNPEGIKFSEDIVKSGNIGDDYSTEQKELAGYIFKEVQGNVSGQFTNEAQIMAYIYTRNSRFRS